MRIIVCIKQVPDTTDVKIDKKTGTLIREGVPSIINPDDKHALEEALRIKEKHGGNILAVSMGPPQAIEALREALAMGVDDAVLLSDRAFAGADTLATSYTLAKCIEGRGGFDLILCGRQAIDGDTAQIGPQMAEQLSIPQVTYVRKVEIKDGKVVAERALEDGYERIEVKLPTLLTVIKELNEPRFPSVKGILASYGRDITVLTGKNMDVEEDRIGLKGSPTQVRRSFAPEAKGEGEILTGTADEMVGKLLERLNEKNILGGGQDA